MNHRVILSIAIVFIVLPVFAQRREAPPPPGVSPRREAPPPPPPVDAGPKPDPRVRPGTTFIIDFPELGPTNHKQPTTQMEIYIPTDYTPDRRFPLLTWFGGGAGSHRVTRPKLISGGKGYICAAMPYRLHDPTKTKSYTDSPGSGWGSPWSYYKPMIDALEKAVPNIHAKKRIAGGFSSGGAAIGHLLDNSKEFREYYYGFMPGNYTSWANKEKYYAGHVILGYSGENDDRYGADSVAKLIRKIEGYGAEMEFIVFKGKGHTDNAPEYYPQMKEWMDRKVGYRGLAEAAQKMDRAVATGKWRAALDAAQEVRDACDASRPEWARANETIRKASVEGEAAYASLTAGKPSERKLRTFIDKWNGTPAADQARQACNALGETMLAGLLKRTPLREKPIEKFMKAWTGFPVYDKAMAAYDGIARKAWEKISGRPKGASRTRLVKGFIKKWDGTPTAAVAKAEIETLAAELLATIKAVKLPGQRKSKLKSFIRNYGDTAAGAEAKALLR